MRTILASASPRRRELLRRLFPEFEIIPAQIAEVIPDGTPCSLASQELAVRKGSAVAADFPTALVISADTTVVIDDRILGKPANKQEAKEMLRLLSGRTHRVYTGCALFYNGRQEAFTSETEVTFYPLTEEEIDAYVESGEPMDKAGAYAVQENAGVFVQQISGDYFGMVGLPIAQLYHRLPSMLHTK